MNETLWLMSQRSDSLQRFIDELQGVWSDQASRDIHTRFLNPHRLDADQMVKTFKNQYEALEEASIKLKRAEGHQVAAQAAEEKVNKSLTYAEGEMRNAEREHEIFAQYEESARSQLVEAQQLMDEANHVCG